MTLDVAVATDGLSEEPPLNGLARADNSGTTLVERITGWLRSRMDQRLLRPGSRLPSIRQFADRHGVSRFTVVEAYERLVAQG
ncbi:MAG: GntR family transcriptional regulator, partial [Candidatus Competibacteraceae bacterium]